MAARDRRNISQKSFYKKCGVRSNPNTVLLYLCFITRAAVRFVDFEPLCLPLGKIISIICKNIIDIDTLSYAEQMERIFARAPKFRADDEDLLKYKYSLGEYLEGLYSLFLEVLSVEPREGCADLFTPFSERQSCFESNTACAHFLFALKIKKLRRGSRIDRYINSIPFPNEYVRRLIESRKGHYILTNADTESLDYKLALLSCFTFYTAENQAALAEKIKAWECRQNKRDPTPFVPIFRA